MKKFAVCAALAAAIGMSCFALPSVVRPAAGEEGGTWSADAEGRMTQTDDGVNFRPGGTYRYSEPIDLENEGFSMSMTVGGEFRREDSWFAVMLTNEYSSQIGEYGGVSFQFKPVSTQGVESGSMPAYVSLYTLGTAEGGSSASAIATVDASEIPERETPYTFNFSVFLKDGTWIVAYGIDTYTYTWSYAGLDLTQLKASLVFGGADADTTDMNVTLKSFGAAKQDVGINAFFAKLLHGVLRRLRLQFARRRNPGAEREVNEARVVAADAERHLADRLNEGQRLDVAHRAADFHDANVGLAVPGRSGAAGDELLNLVRDVRNHLHGLAEVFAPALLAQHAFVDLARREVVGLVHLRRDEAFVVAEVKVGLRAVFRDEDLAVLEGRHRARIHVDVGIELDHRHLESAGLEDRRQRSGGDAFPERGDNAAGHKYVLRHECFNLSWRV